MRATKLLIALGMSALISAAAESRHAYSQERLQQLDSSIEEGDGEIYEEEIAPPGPIRRSAPQPEVMSEFDGALDESDTVAEAPRSRRTRDEDSNSNAQSPVWIFLGVDGGYAGLSSTIPDENFRNGSQFNLKGLASWYFDRKLVMDFGLGWTRTQLEENSPLGIAGLITRAGNVELGLRYRGERWQLGPYVGMLFGTDLTFNPDFNPALTATPLLLGAQAFYEIPYDTHRLRLGARVGTDLSISQRQFLTAQASVQIGLPLPARWFSKEYALKPKRRVRRSAEPIAIRYGSDTVQVELRSEFVNFATNRSEISPIFQAYLNDLGALLARNPDAFGRLVVEGHTDIRGGYDFNMKLSGRRANSVAKALVARGVPILKIRTAAFGYTRPIDPSNNEDAWAKNRRVEIKFDGVKNPRDFAIQLQSLQP